jgi:hypothetical protein
MIPKASKPVKNTYLKKMTAMNNMEETNSILLHSVDIYS